MSTRPSIPIPVVTNGSDLCKMTLSQPGKGPSCPRSSRPPHPLPEQAGRNAEGERWLQLHLPHGERKCQTFLQCHPSSADKPLLPPPQASSWSPHPVGPRGRSGQEWAAGRPAFWAVLPGSQEVVWGEGRISGDLSCPVTLPGVLCSLSPVSCLSQI